MYKIDHVVHTHTYGFSDHNGNEMVAQYGVAMKYNGDPSSMAKMNFICGSSSMA